MREGEEVRQKETSQENFTPAQKRALLALRADGEQRTLSGRDVRMLLSFPWQIVEEMFAFKVALRPEGIAARAELERENG